MKAEQEDSIQQVICWGWDQENCNVEQESEDGISAS